MEPQQPLICPSHTTQYIGVLVVGILVGVGSSFVYFKQSPVDTNNTYKAGFDAAKKRVTESPMGMVFRTPDDIRSVSGTVTGIQGNRITIHTQLINPFDDPVLLDRIVVFTSDTKIIKLTQKDPKVFQAEMTDFMKKMQATRSSSQPPVPPTPSAVTTGTTADIVVGSTINVIAVENIKTIKEFPASEIQIQSKLITN